MNRRAPSSGSAERQPTFRRNMSPTSSSSKNKPSKKPAWKQVATQVTLRPTVNRPVSPGVKPRLGPKTRFLLLSDSCGFVDVGRPIWREDGSVICRGHSSTWHLYLHVYLSAFYIVICQESGSLWMHIIYSFTYNSSIYVQYIQGLCQSRLGTVDRALTHVAHVTTAA
jgi:hypothetical protein